MKKIFLSLLATFSLLVLFQNTVNFNQAIPLGEVGGVGKYPRGYVVWGWACREGMINPVSLDLYFQKQNEKYFWKSVVANLTYEEDKKEISEKCRTAGAYHKFIEHIPNELVKKYSGFTVSAEIPQTGGPFVLPKGSAHSQTIVFDETSAYTKAGWVKGEASSLFAHVELFKGIPYAKPPVGQLRWAQSVEPAPWTGEREATKFSSACMQEDGHLPTGVENAISRSEDCLYLNVWKSSKVSNAPVYVYIHGGQFKGGWSGLPDYDGAYLASRGVVVVTFNYRVGMMGFFSHLYFKNKRGNINFGLSDQELALKWVQANISEFGGDPKNVTIAGSSAGGASVGFWVANKVGVEKDGQGALFHRAIIESGGGSLDSYLETKTLAEARGQQMTEALLTHLSSNPINHFTLESLPACKINKTSDACMEEVLFKTPADVLKNTRYFNRYKNATTGEITDPLTKNSGFEFHPYLDSHYVPGGTIDIFKCGLQKNIPLIVGSMGWEADIVEKVIQKNPTPFLKYFNLTTLQTKFGIKDPVLLAERVYGDRTFAVPARILARLHSAVNPYTYSYLFNYVGDNLTDEVRTYSKGATHSMLDPFVFNSISTTRIKDFVKPTENDTAVAKVWSGYWENFIRGKIDNNGNIRSASGSTALWEPYDPQLDNRLLVNHSGKIVSPGVREIGSKHSYMTSAFLKSRYDYIESVFFPARLLQCR